MVKIILVITIISGNGWGGSNSSTSTVEGFSTIENCQIAADDFKNQFLKDNIYPRSKVTAVCITK